jgi:hypothetical protein
VHGLAGVAGLQVCSHGVWSVSGHPKWRPTPCERGDRVPVVFALDWNICLTQIVFVPPNQSDYPCFGHNEPAAVGRSRFAPSGVIRRCVSGSKRRLPVRFGEPETPQRFCALRYLGEFGVAAMAKARVVKLKRGKCSGLTSRYAAMGVHLVCRTLMFV